MYMHNYTIHFTVPTICWNCFVEVDIMKLPSVAHKTTNCLPELACVQCNNYCLCTNVNVHYMNNYYLLDRMCTNMHKKYRRQDRDPGWLGHILARIIIIYLTACVPTCIKSTGDKIGIPDG